MTFSPRDEKDISRLVAKKLEQYLNVERRESRFHPQGYHKTTPKMQTLDLMYQVLETTELDQPKTSRSSRQKSPEKKKDRPSPMKPDGEEKYRTVDTSRDSDQTSSADSKRHNRKKKKEKKKKIQLSVVQNSRRVVSNREAERLTDNANKIFTEQPLDKLQVIHRYRPHSNDIPPIVENGRVQNYNCHVGSALHAKHYVDYYMKEGLQTGNKEYSKRLQRLGSPDKTEEGEKSNRESIGGCGQGAIDSDWERTHGRMREVLSSQAWSSSVVCHPGYSFDGIHSDASSSGCSSSTPRSKTNTSIHAYTKVAPPHRLSGRGATSKESIPAPESAGSQEKNRHELYMVVCSNTSHVSNQERAEVGVCEDYSHLHGGEKEAVGSEREAGGDLKVNEGTENGLSHGYEPCIAFMPAGYDSLDARAVRSGDTPIMRGGGRNDDTEEEEAPDSSATDYTSSTSTLTEGSGTPRSLSARHFTFDPQLLHTPRSQRSSLSHTSPRTPLPHPIPHCPLPPPAMTKGALPSLQVVIQPEGSVSARQVKILHTKTLVTRTSASPCSDQENYRVGEEGTSFSMGENLLDHQGRANVPGQKPVTEDERAEDDVAEDDGENRAEGNVWGYTGNEDYVSTHLDLSQEASHVFAFPHPDGDVTGSRSKEAGEVKQKPSKPHPQGEQLGEKHHQQVDEEQGGQTGAEQTGAEQTGAEQTDAEQTEQQEEGSGQEVADNDQQADTDQTLPPQEEGDQGEEADGGESSDNTLTHEEGDHTERGTQTDTPPPQPQLLSSSVDPPPPQSSASPPEGSRENAERVTSPTPNRANELEGLDIERGEDEVPNLETARGMPPEEVCVKTKAVRGDEGIIKERKLPSRPASSEGRVGGSYETYSGDDRGVEREYFMCDPAVREVYTTSSETQGDDTISDMESNFSSCPSSARIQHSQASQASAASKSTAASRNTTTSKNSTTSRNKTADENTSERIRSATNLRGVVLQEALGEAFPTCSPVLQALDTALLGTIAEEKMTVSAEAFLMTPVERTPLSSHSKSYRSTGSGQDIRERPPSAQSKFSLYGAGHPDKDVKRPASAQSRKFFYGAGSQQRDRSASECTHPHLKDSFPPKPDSEQSPQTDSKGHRRSSSSSKSSTSHCSSASTSSRTPHPGTLPDKHPKTSTEVVIDINSVNSSCPLPAEHPSAPSSHDGSIRKGKHGQKLPALELKTSQTEESYKKIEATSYPASPGFSMEIFDDEQLGTAFNSSGLRTYQERPPSVSSQGSDRERPPSVTSQRSEKERPPSVSSQRSEKERPPSVTSQRSEKERPPSVTSQRSEKERPPSVTSQRSEKERPPSVTSQRSEKERPPSVTSQRSEKERPPSVSSQRSEKERPPSVTSQRSEKERPPSVTSQRSEKERPPSVSSQRSEKERPPSVSSQRSEKERPPSVTSQRSEKESPPSVSSQRSEKERPPSVSSQRSEKERPPSVSSQRSEKEGLPSVEKETPPSVEKERPPSVSSQRSEKERPPSVSSQRSEKERPPSVSSQRSEKERPPSVSSQRSEKERPPSVEKERPPSVEKERPPSVSSQISEKERPPSVSSQRSEEEKSTSVDQKTEINTSTSVSGQTSGKERSPSTSSQRESENARPVNSHSIENERPPSVSSQRSEKDTPSLIQSQKKEQATPPAVNDLEAEQQTVQPKEKTEQDSSAIALQPDNLPEATGNPQENASSHVEVQQETERRSSIDIPEDVQSSLAVPPEPEMPLPGQSEIDKPSDVQQEMENPQSAQQEMARSPSVQQEADETTSVQQEAEIPPSVQQETEIPPSVQQETEIPPSVQQETEIPPSVQQEAEIPPSVQQEAERQPSVQQEADKTISVQQEAEIPPPVQQEAEIPPPVQQEAERQPSVQQEAEKPPSVQQEAERQPSVQQEAEKPPYVQQEAEIPPSVQQET
ncbi:hypothetical protein ACOMHN_022590 [Nucella lapillus]